MQRIAEAVRENENIVTLTIDSRDGDRFPGWTAGQFLRISVFRDEEWSEEHTFTLSSAPEDDIVQITVKAVGPFTTSLQTIEPGTPVRVRGPYGSFCKGIDSLPAVTMIAGGIGITPFLSVLRHFARAGVRSSVTLLWANNALSDIIRHDELVGLIGALDLRVVHVLWKESVSSLPAARRQNEVYHEGLLREEILTKHCDMGACPLFVCGPPRMNEHMTGVLQGLGIDMSEVHTETQAPPKKPKT